MAAAPLESQYIVCKQSTASARLVMQFTFHLHLDTGTFIHFSVNFAVEWGNEFIGMNYNGMLIDTIVYLTDIIVTSPDISHTHSVL